MSGVEPEVRDFLKRIVSSIFVGILWLLVNMTIGIYWGLLFFDDGNHWLNIIYYLFLFTTLFFLIRFYYKIWSKKFPHA